MTYGTTGGKRQREANRDKKKKEKQERLQRNRSMRGQGADTFSADEAPASGARQAEVKLEDINISGVAPRTKGGGPASGPARLFVGGLSWDTDDAELQAAFGKFGPLVDVAVIQDRQTGRSRGFGFVTFVNTSDAEKAIREMNGADLAGRTLKVNAAEPR